MTEGGGGDFIDKAVDDAREAPAPRSPRKRAQVSRKHMPSPKPPNRNRRANFSFITVGTSMVMMAIFAFKGMGSEVAMSALDGFKDIAIFIGVAYIGGSAADFGTMMISRGRGRGRAGGGYDPYGADEFGQGDGRISD